MYAVIRRYRVEGDVDEVVSVVDAEYAAAVEQQVGFVEYRVVRTGAQEVTTVIQFETKAAADRNRSFAELFVEVGLVAFEVELLDERRGEVLVSHVADPGPQALPADR